MDSKARVSTGKQTPPHTDPTARPAGRARSRKQHVRAREKVQWVKGLAARPRAPRCLQMSFQEAEQIPQQGGNGCLQSVQSQKLLPRTFAELQVSTWSFALQHSRIPSLLSPQRKPRAIENLLVRKLQTGWGVPRLSIYTSINRQGQENLQVPVLGS